MQRQLVISEIAPCGWSSYFTLPKEKRNPVKRLSNIQHEDNECFRRCLIRYLNPVNKNPANADKEFAKKLDFNAIKHTVHEKDYAEIEIYKIIFLLMCLVLKMKHHTVFILQNKVFKNLIIYDYYRILKITSTF